MNNLSRQVIDAIGDAVVPLLSDPDMLRAAAAVTQVKSTEHTAHRIDAIAEAALFDALRHADFRGSVYSEESGLTSLGASADVFICDPYCNTMLTFRGFRESAIACYHFSGDNKCISGAILDLQFPRMAAWDGNQVSEYVRGRFRRTLHSAAGDALRLENAFVVMSLLKSKRRKRFPRVVFETAGQISVIDGAIVGARLCFGDVDAFIDSEIGQPSYEALAYLPVSILGGVVSEPGGMEIDFGQIVESLRAGEVGRVRVVAAKNHGLHSDILARIRNDR